MMADIQTPIGDAPVIPVILIISGGYLLWFGVHYWRRNVKWPTDPVKAVLQGKSPPSAGAAPETTVQLLSVIESGTQGGTPQSSSATGSSIGDDAMQYNGQGYVWGGHADKPGNWDCSSFVSYVLGHDLGYTLPGNGHWNMPGYPPNAHGPTTLQYALYGTGINRSDVQSGDLIVWQTHMGIAISNTQMISARDPQQGTGIDNIDGDIPGETPNFRRVAGQSVSPGTQKLLHGGV